jgi:hypothetical protein
MDEIQALFSKDEKMHSQTLIVKRFALVGFVAVVVGTSVTFAATLPSLRDFSYVGSLTVTDTSSPIAGLHHFFANAVAKKALWGGGPYPKGAEFRGRLYEVEQNEFGIIAGKLKATTVMRKDPAEKDTGGWLFSVVTPDGKTAKLDVKTACFTCHQKAKDRDFVFSRSLD